MAVSLAEISRRLEIPLEDLEKKSLLSFIAHEIRMAEWDISEIRERYDVSSRVELEGKIKAKAVYSHPAWEDLIHWENLENYIARLGAIEEEVKVAA
jgi:hypothetical protein